MFIASQDWSRFLGPCHGPSPGYQSKIIESTKNWLENTFFDCKLQVIARKSCKNLSYKWWHEWWKIQTYDKTHMFSATDSEQAAQWHHGSCTSPPAPFSSAIPSSANIKQLDIPGTPNSESLGITENCRIWNTWSMHRESCGQWGRICQPVLFSSLGGSSFETYLGCLR